MTTKYEQYQQQIIELKQKIPLDIGDIASLIVCLSAIVKEDEAELSFQEKLNLFAEVIQEKDNANFQKSVSHAIYLYSMSYGKIFHQEFFKLLCTQGVDWIEAHPDLVSLYLDTLSVSLHYAMGDVGSDEALANDAEMYLTLLKELQPKLDPQAFLQVLQFKVSYHFPKKSWLSLSATVEKRVQAMAKANLGNENWRDLLTRYQAFYGQAIVTTLSHLPSPLSNPKQDALISKKRLVSRYLLSLNKDDTHIALLRQALQSDTALGRFCAQKTGSIPWKKAQLVLDIEARLKEWAPKLTAPPGENTNAVGSVTHARPVSRASLVIVRSDPEKRQSNDLL